jgi:hypothetical protein
MIITVGADVPDTLRIGLLLDNTGNSWHPTVSSPTGAFDSVAVDTWQYYGIGNHFLYFDIVGLQGGDQIAIAVNKLGGVTFDGGATTPVEGGITIVNADEDPITVNSVGASTGVGEDGYYFFAPEPEATATTGYSSVNLWDIPSYVANINPGATTGYLSTSNTDLGIGGTLYTTGKADTRINNMVITVGADVPDTLRIGLLLDNTGNSWHPTISSPTGAFDTVTVDSWQYYGLGNHFLFFDITGLQAGDQIAIAVNNLGGVTFDTIA